MQGKNAFCKDLNDILWICKYYRNIKILKISDLKIFFGEISEDKMSPSVVPDKITKQLRNIRDRFYKYYVFKNGILNFLKIIYITLYLHIPSVSKNLLIGRRFQPAGPIY